MIKKLFLTAVMLAGALTSMAELTAADAFTSAPQNIFPLLDRNTRLDMVDYVKSGLSTPSQNSLQGRSAITELTPQALTVKMSDSSAAQIAVLQGAKGEVIALISTVATPGLDSTIRFYDSSWKPLDGSSFFSKPGWNEWLTADGRENRDEVTMQVPFMLASYRIDPASSQLVLTNNLSRFLDKDVYSMIESYLRPSLTYSWNGKKFVGR